MSGAAAWPGLEPARARGTYAASGEKIKEARESSPALAYGSVGGSEREDYAPARVYIRTA